MLTADISTTDLVIIGLIMFTPCNLVLFLFYCVYLLLMHTVLAAIKPPNRYLHPYAVWLLLVPGVSVLCYFPFIYLLARSIRAEYRERGSPRAKGRCGRPLALVGAIVNTVWLGVVISHFLFKPNTDFFDVEWLVAASAIVLACNLLTMAVHFLMLGWIEQDLR